MNVPQIHAQDLERGFLLLGDLGHQTYLDIIDADNADSLFADAIEAAITPRTRGIIVVHLLGQPADMDPIMRVASTHGLWVVEDAAEAPFATYKGRPVGSIGQAASFSFYGNKMLTSGATLSTIVGSCSHAPTSSRE